MSSPAEHRLLATTSSLFGARHLPTLARRNSHIFNIFALVDIGERSGMGLADLYGHWTKNNLPAPIITEEYDPDRVKVTVYTDSDQGPTKTRPRSDQTAQGAPRVPQAGPRPAQGRPKINLESAQGKMACPPMM